MIKPVLDYYNDRMSYLDGNKSQQEVLRDVVKTINKDLDMKMHTFLQNKLWRDKAVDLTEAMGSKVYWQRLDDSEYDKQLRLKLLEEAEEVAAAKTHAELISECADVLDVINALCLANNIPLDDVRAAQHKKHQERGGFDGRRFVTKAAHPEGSYSEQYCLADPKKYPEIIEP